MSWQKPASLMTCIVFMPDLVYLPLDIYYGNGKYTFILFNHCCFDVCYNMQSSLIRTGVSGKTFKEERTTCVEARGMISLGACIQLEWVTWCSGVTGQVSAGADPGCKVSWTKLRSCGIKGLEGPIGIQ